jgi:hypothetical protein
LLTGECVTSKAEEEDQSEIFRPQASPLGDPRRHPWPDLVLVVEGKLEIRPTGPGQRAVRTVLPPHPSSDPLECG